MLFPFECANLFEPLNSETGQDAPGLIGGPRQGGADSCRSHTVPVLNVEPWRSGPADVAMIATMMTTVAVRAMA